MELAYTEFRSEWLTSDVRLRTYRAYIPPPIADLDLELPSGIAERERRALAACAAVADGAFGRTAEALARQLLRTEAVASSRIEGYRVSHRNLARALARGAADPGARDAAAFVAGNIAAMESAIALGAAGPLDAEAIAAIHLHLLTGTRDEPIGGRVRDGQNWIGGPGPHAAEFVPPPPDEVPRLLDDLAAFAAREDVPPITQAAIAHAQFETIHPFADGNGRVGRALVHALLRRRGVCRDAAIPFSLGLAASGDRYPDALTAYRYRDVWEWVGYFAEQVEEAAAGTAGLARRIDELQVRWFEAAGRPRPQSAAARMLPRLVEMPIYTIPQMAALAGMSAESVRVGSLRLADAGVVRTTTTGRRNRVFEAVGLFEILDTVERELARP